MAIEYTPLPPPQNQEGMSTYLNNELIRLSQAISAISTTARGSLYLAATSATQSVSTTPVLLNVFDTEIDPNTINVDILTNSITAIFEGAYSSTVDAIVSTGGSNVTINFSLYVNGSPMPSGTASALAKTAGEPVALSFSTTGNISRGSKLEVYVSVSSGTETLTFTRLNWGISGQVVS